MAKAKLKSGDILQIPLPNGLGFAYAKCINLLELDPDSSYPTLIRVYNYRSNIPEVDTHELISRDLILSPLLIAGILPAIKSGQWKVIDNVPVNDEEKRIPHYKKPEPDEANVKDWYYLIDADIAKKVKAEYESIKHLETIGATGSELVGTKIAMALLRDEGKNIADFFELNEYFEKAYYEQVKQIPAYYKQPETMRGKAIES